MKKILMTLALFLSTSAWAGQKETFCTEMTVRYTAFSMLALSTPNKQNYESFLYKSILEGNADKSSQEILLKLIDFAWENRGKDINHTAMTFWHACVEGQST